MTKQIFIGLATEGTTDERFLKSLIVRTFEEIALTECVVDIDIFVQSISVGKSGLSFPEYVVKCSGEGLKRGIMTLAIHTDADRETYEERIQDKIEPARQLLNQQADEDYCKLLTPVIPVRMIEAWMLADKELLKNEIGTRKSDHELKIDRNPEIIADPKACIEEAIRIATSDLPNRRHKLSIADLYEIMGDKISIESLMRLDSYKKFVDEVRRTYRALNYL
ncbi:DUF4276 family protein [Mediterranea massiliensis]|uniref:DUF4276 family protein n=1 Tax=Mediterranea massiliensis TaxID=1841865 RepID=A0ABS2DWC2_9BACT|nr:DUF4276 family protein [Mediterranea massiliensis]MBM6733790.1 DUF4276 family protein [Mediterranea massiliensis]